MPLTLRSCRWELFFSHSTCTRIVLHSVVKIDDEGRGLRFRGDEGLDVLIVVNALRRHIDLIRTCLEYHDLALSGSLFVVRDHELNVQGHRAVRRVLRVQHGVMKRAKHRDHLLGVGLSHQRSRALVAQCVQLHVNGSFFTVQKQRDAFGRGVFVVIGHSVLSAREPNRPH